MKLETLMTVLVLAAHTAAAAPTPAPVPPTVRLDDRARPMRYGVELTVVPTEERFTGAIDIEVELRRATDTLWLEGQRLEVRRAVVRAPGDVAARVIPGGKDFIGLQL